MAYVVGKFTAGAIIKGHHVLIKGAEKIREDDAEKTE